MVQNLQRFEILLEAVHNKTLNQSSSPHVCSCQDITHVRCDAMHIQQHLLQQGIPRDCPRLRMTPMALRLAHSQLVCCKIHRAGRTQATPHSPSYPKADTCSHHWKTPPGCQVWESLEARRKLLQNCTRFYSVPAQRTGLQWLRRSYHGDTKTK